MRKRARNDIRDTNLELLTELRRHLDGADRLRELYGRLLSFAGPVRESASPNEPETGCPQQKGAAYAV
jgi:hypothetical protein